MMAKLILWVIAIICFLTAVYFSVIGNRNAFENFAFLALFNYIGCFHIEERF